MSLHQRLQNDAAPVRELAVVVWMGDMADMSIADEKEKYWYSHDFKDALSSRMPAIFKANGFPLKVIVVSKAKPEKNEWPRINVDFGDVSHVLVLRAHSYLVMKYGTQVSYEAYLWDARTKQAVWKGSPFVGLVTSQPLLRAQLLAGEILNSLKQDGLITLKSENAIDLEGNPITNGYYIHAEDK